MTNIMNRSDTPNSTLEAANDKLYMRRCIELALNSEGRTYPNPMVGAVVVCDGKIIGEGWHRKAGEPHAEVNAINCVKDQSQLSRSTIYVSLEPCSHHGRTPPCADLIIEKGIPRVVVGCRDSFAKVDGRGIRKLRDAGVDVTVGVMEDECRWLNRRFFTMQEKGRPYVILKWAETADGYMGAIKNGRPAPVSISNAEAFTMSHKQRTTEDGILVGIGTVVSDNPHLTSRLWTGPSPLRIVIDPHGDIPPESNVLTDGGRTLVISGVSEGVHGEVRYIKADITAGNLAQTAIESAKAVGVSSVIVEGGAHTLSHFIESGLWDEAYIYCSDHVMGEGIESPRLGSGELIEVVHMGDVTLRRFKSRELFNGKYFEKI